MSLQFILPLLAAFVAPCLGQTIPPWSKGLNNPALDKGQVLGADDIDNVPDLHGNPIDALLVLFVGGNQFFVMPQLVADFEVLHPELRGRIFYETLPPGLMRKQMQEGGAVTLGNLTLVVRPDVYEAGSQTMSELQKAAVIDHLVPYTTNVLEIMVAKGNPLGIRGLADLSKAKLRLSMPNPQTEGIARQIAECLHKVGGDALADSVYKGKVGNGTSYLTQIHHRQTPIRIMQGKSDAGVVWASEVRFQERIGNPVEGVRIPEAQNTTATYTAGVLTDAPHRAAAVEWVDFLRGAKAQAAYAAFGFKERASAVAP
jgi:molybdate transport system substrate-binding protein